MNRLQSIPLCVVVAFALTPLASQNDPLEPGLSDQERQRILERHEALWEHRQPARVRMSVRDRIAYTRNALSETMPRISRRIRGGVSENIDFGNLRLSIPADAFPRANEIKVEAIVLIKPEDFAFAGPDTKLTGADQDTLLESTGMFRLAFRDERGRNIEPRAPLTASMPYQSQSADARVYQFKNDRWVERSGRAVSLNAAAVYPLGQDVGNPTNPTPQRRVIGENGQAVENPANPTAGEFPEGESFEGEGNYFHFPQVYDQIDASGWWNFDIPRDEYTCITVKLESAPDGAYTQVTGVDYRGNSVGEERSGGTMAFNALRDSQIIIYTTYHDPDSEEVRVGSLRVDDTPSHIAHTKESGTSCPMVGRITLASYTKDDVKEQEDFLQIIGWPGR